MRVLSPGSGEKLRSTATRTADGQVHIEARFILSDFFKIEDLFLYGMVPQFIARFDNVVLLSDLGPAVLKEILLNAVDSPLVRSRRFLEVMGIALEIDDLAAALVAEQAEKHARTGARALRTIFARIINPLEYDPSDGGHLEALPDGGKRLLVTADMVRRSLNG
jgi:ATP-dependent Clp protease ATP-binding subunit ClpX